MKALIISSLFFVSSAFAAEVDLKKSNFEWKGTKVTGQHVGTIQLKSAKVDMKEKKIAGGEFVMDLNSVNVTDLEGEYKQKLESHLKSADFFDTSKHSTATLKVSKVDDKNIHGELTIKGKTEKVSFPYTKSGNTYSGSLKFDRTKFGMTYNSGNFFKKLGDKMIHDEVNLKFKVVLK